MIVTFVNFSIILVIITPIFSQIEVRKTCNLYPPILNVPDLNSSKLMGQWFEIKRYDNYYETGQCVYNNFTISNLKPTIIHSETNNHTIRNTTQNIAINETSIVADDKGILSNITVLGIDYTDYAVAWACADINTTYSKQLLWILSRNKTLTSKASESIDNILTLTTIKSDKIYQKTIAHDEDTCNSGNNLQINLFIIATIVFCKMLLY